MAVYSTEQDDEFHLEAKPRAAGLGETPRVKPQRTMVKLKTRKKKEMP